MCYKLQNNKTKAVSLIRLSLKRYMTSGSMCRRPPASQAMHSDSLLKDQALAKSKPNCQPGMSLEENTEGKVLLTGDKELKKGKFCGSWELKMGWGVTGGRAEHRGRAEQHSSAHSSQRSSRPGDVQTAPHWCSRTLGCDHQQPGSPPGALRWFCNTVGSQFQALFSYYKENLIL